MIENKLHRPDRRSSRRDDAEDRQKTYDLLSTAQKLEKLDIKFGNGLGATKERAKLTKSAPTKLLKVEEKEKEVQKLPDTILAEIDAMNDEGSSKKKLKAKDRRNKAK